MFALGVRTINEYRVRWAESGMENIQREVEIMYLKGINEI